MSELFSQGMPVLVGLVAVAVAYAAIHFGQSRIRQKNPKIAPAAIRQQRLEEIAATEKAAFSTAIRATLAVEVIAQHLEGFDLGAFLEHARALQTAAQRARATGKTPELEASLYGAALGIALASGPGLESVDNVIVGPPVPTKASGSAAGSGIDVRFNVTCEDVRNGERQLVQSEEVWRFGWPPEGNAWKVFTVERSWRRVMDAAVLLVEMNPPAKRARSEEGFEDRLQTWAETHDWDATAFDATVRDACIAWVKAVDQADPGSLEAVAGPGVADGVLAHARRYGFFDQRMRWLDLEIHEVVPCRMLVDGVTTWISARVVGSLVERLDIVGGEEGLAVPRSWARYLTFRLDNEAGWQLEYLDDDDSWVV